MRSEELYRTIETENRNSSIHGIVERRIPSDSCDMFAGIEYPAGARVMLLRMSRSVATRLSRLPESRGFEVRVYTFPQDGPETASVLLRLLNSDYSDVFTSLVDDVAATMDHVARSDRAIAAAFIERLARWQRFLSQHEPEGLSEEAQRGLYGELWFFRKYLLPNLSSQAAVKAWTGPQRAPHDYQLPSCAVEVKTSIAKQHQNLRIASERQLDDSNIDALFLCHLSLDMFEGSGDSLVDAVQSIRDALSGDVIATAEWEERLFSAGYLDAHSHHYSGRGYAIRNSYVFRIREGFPRIVESQLANGVGDVTYSISVASCMPFSVEDSDIVSCIVRSA